MEEIGRKLIEVIQAAYNEPFTLQSDYARNNTVYVATAASLGFVSCLSLDRYVTKQWRATPKGIDYVMRNI